MEGLGTVSPTNDYSYNGKELNEDFGLNLSDYGARWYDAAVGRWWNVDPMGEKTVSFSTYQYVLNNPLILVDPSGMSPKGARENAEDLQRWDEYYKEKDEARKQGKVAQKIEELKAADSGSDPRTVYILQLNGANGSLVKKAQALLTECAKAAGLNVIFLIISPDAFDITKIALTDAVAVVGGSNKETADFILNNINKGYLSSTYQDKLVSYGKSNPIAWSEVADSGFGTEWGYVIATTSNVGTMSVKDSKTGATTTSSVVAELGAGTPPGAIALTILHGMGHLSGLMHPKNDIGFMLDGNEVGRYMSPFKGNISAAFCDTLTRYSTIKQAFFQRFGFVWLKP